jgi:hypothetical protein
MFRAIACNPKENDEMTMNGVVEVAGFTVPSGRELRKVWGDGTYTYQSREIGYQTDFEREMQAEAEVSA